MSIEQFTKKLKSLKREEYILELRIKQHGVASKRVSNNESRSIDRLHGNTKRLNDLIESAKKQDILYCKKCNDFYSKDKIAITTELEKGTHFGGHGIIDYRGESDYPYVGEYSVYKCKKGHEIERSMTKQYKDG